MAGFNLCLFFVKIESIMNIRIIALREELLNQEKKNLEKKLRRLGKLTSRYGEKADLEVVIKKVLPQETGDIFLGEAKFMIPGKDIFCRVRSNNIETLGDKLKDKLKNLIISKKEERQSRWRRLTRLFKHR